MAISQADALKVAKWYRKRIGPHLNLVDNDKNCASSVMNFVNRPEYMEKMEEYCKERHISHADVQELFELLQETHDKLHCGWPQADLKRQLAEFLKLEGS
jgi:hypothetical protein